MPRDKEPKRTFETYPIGYFHIDIAEVPTAESELRLFVAIDRTSKVAFIEPNLEGGKMIAAPARHGIKHLESVLSERNGL